MIFCDTEYNDTQVLLWISIKGDEVRCFDLRDDFQIQELSDYIKENTDEVFCSYACHAEITSLLKIGIDVSQMRWIDSMAECRMISMSHQKYFTLDGTMLSQVKCFLGRNVDKDKVDKILTRDLILSKNTWSDDEWNKILLYCYQDVQVLPELWNKIVDVHVENDHPYTISQAALRGEYIRMSAEMDFCSLGFPVYGGDIRKIYSNLKEIKKRFAYNLPAEWRSCYVSNKTGGITLKIDRVSEVIRNNAWDWNRTDNGGPNLEQDYLKEMQLQIPEVRPFYLARKSISTLSSKTDLSLQVVDDYIKTKTFAFSAKTGRNGNRPTQGYLLNLPKWMRKIIHPHPGMAMVSVDWSQQEIAIAAKLSGDEKLMNAYNSGDVYLSLGKMSGSIPEEGTKKTHSTQRELFKALQLGLGYGKGKRSLGKDFFGIMKKDGIDQSRAAMKAAEIYNWHKNYFRTYWWWIGQQISTARSRGWIETSDNWVEWVGSRTKDTQLLNFPSQSHGAVMMRAAAKMFYAEWRAGKLEPVLCSLHDAFYFNIPIEKLEEQIPIIENIMKITGIKVIGAEVRSNTKIYDTEESYEPEGMEEDHKRLWELAIGEE
jgi:hypothetical protein